MIAHLLARILEAPLRTAIVPAHPLDAIVVLGSPLRDNALTPALAERAAAAAALFHAHAAPLVLATGGITRDATRAEADALADALRDHGVTRILVERASLTTADNARLSAPLLAAAGARSAWIVTQPFHARRAVRLFRAAGIDAHAWHIADSLQYRDRRRAVRWLVREYAAWTALFARR